MVGFLHMYGGFQFGAVLTAFYLSSTKVQHTGPSLFSTYDYMGLDPARYPAKISSMKASSRPDCI